LNINRLLVGTLALIFIVGITTPAFADEVIFLHSGNGPAGTSIDDTKITVKAGAGDTTDFNASPTSYDDAFEGPQARIVNPNSAWVCNGFTPFDVAPRWIGTQDSAAANDPDALYAIQFEITDTVIGSATLSFRGCSDNTFGHVGHQGLSVNEIEIGGTNGGSHINSIAFNDIDITSLVNTGKNTLYIYQNDVGGPAGTLFSAQITVIGTSPTCPFPNADLRDLLDDPENCIIVDDKKFTNFRDYTGGNFAPFIDVDGITAVNGEKGLQFSTNRLRIESSGGTAVTNISFKYDVISSGDPISDNTLTLTDFGVFGQPDTVETNVFVTESVFSDVGQSRPDFITGKEVSADATGNEVLSQHVDYPSLHQMVSIQVDIGLSTDFNCNVCRISIDEFTQTFSQTARPTTPVGGELIPIESTSLLLAGAQSFSWMIPVVLSILGIGLFVVSRKSE